MKTNINQHISKERYDQAVSYVKSLYEQYQHSPNSKEYFKENWKRNLNNNSEETHSMATSIGPIAAIKFLVASDVPEEEILSMTYREAIAYIYLLY